MEFKVKMSRKEMEEKFLEEFPYFVPNNMNIGLFAKRNGYKPVKQVIKGVFTSFYVKLEK